MGLSPAGLLMASILGANVGESLAESSLIRRIRIRTVAFVSRGIRRGKLLCRNFLEVLALFGIYTPGRLRPYRVASKKQL